MGWEPILERYKKSQKMLNLKERHIHLVFLVTCTNILSIDVAHCHTQYRTVAFLTQGLVQWKGTNIAKKNLLDLFDVSGILGDFIHNVCISRYKFILHVTFI